MSFNGKVVWITGASSGIGEALTKSLIDAGASVILSGRRESELRRVAKQAGGKTLVLPFDVADPDAIPQAVNCAWNWEAGVDLLINNAGVAQRSLAVDTSFDTYRRLMDVNFNGPLQLTQLVLPHMINRGHGHIVAVSSVAGKVGSPLMSGYCASKHALIGYFDALRSEVELAYGIKVSVIVSGFVKTAMARNALRADGVEDGSSGYEMGHAYSAEEAASFILEGLLAGKREITFARGMEFEGLVGRANNPEHVFDVLAQMGAQLASERELLLRQVIPGVST